MVSSRTFPPQKWDFARPSEIKVRLGVWGAVCLVPVLRAKCRGCGDWPHMRQVGEQDPRGEASERPPMEQSEGFE